MLSDQFYEKRLSVRKRNMKFLLETVTYIAIKERVPCIIAIEMVMFIMHCRKYHLHNCNRDSHLHNYSKNCHPHILCRNCHLHMCCRNFSLHNCNRKIHQHTSNRKYHVKTCINATDVITCIIAIESVSCIVPTETASCSIDYRKFHLQKWCQSDILLVTIKKLSE